MQTPLVHIKKFAQLYGVFVTYLVGSLIIGEFHPFSRYPMYNNLPNWSYAFYFADEHNRLIPGKQIKVYGGELGHLYSAIAQQHSIAFGEGKETDKQLHFIGKIITEHALRKNKETFVSKRIKLIRVYYRLSDNQIITQTTCMYEKSLE